MFLSTLSVQEILLTQTVWGCIIKEEEYCFAESEPAKDVLHMNTF